MHLADPAKLALIFNKAKKNDKEGSYKLAKLLRVKICARKNKCVTLHTGKPVCLYERCLC